MDEKDKNPEILSGIKKSKRFWKSGSSAKEDMTDEEYRKLEEQDQCERFGDNEGSY